MRELPGREVPELPGAKIPKYGISADKSILPVGYPYSMGNYPWVQVIWLPIPVRVQVRFFPPQYPWVLPTVTHGLPMSSLRRNDDVGVAVVILAYAVARVGSGTKGRHEEHVGPKG